MTKELILVRLRKIEVEMDKLLKDPHSTVGELASLQREYNELKMHIEAQRNRESVNSKVKSDRNAAAMLVETNNLKL